MVKAGLIGFGTVGAGVARLLTEDRSSIASRSGKEIELVYIADVDISKDRGIDTSRVKLTRDANDILNDPSVSIVIEAVGGTGVALEFARKALSAGKHFVTTNKELIAKHMKELSGFARKNKVSLLFEGAVGGGIPIIAPLRNSLAGNDIKEVFGIVNGTTNYILSKMTNNGWDFASTLKDAQQKGYAEADPKSDVEGYDASYKAAILAAVSFGGIVDWNDVHFEGISKISAEDIEYASGLGYVIKLLAVAKKVSADTADVRVHPTLISKAHPLASVNDVYNAIYVRGSAVGELMFYGQGAGSLPTASAAVSDVVEIASLGGDPYYVPDRAIKVRSINEAESKYYIRMHVKEMPGVLSGISGVFGEHKVSIASVIQKETIDNIATIVIITHKVKEKEFSESLAAIEKLPTVAGIGNVIRVGME